ncbi:necrosis inducing protein [Biscogniauxia mediterranea]|nr:necrosis inducing protein [Biscogniauxia mediterranea]
MATRSRLRHKLVSNVPAVDAEGDVAKGLDHNYSGSSENCRDASDLDNNNVYSRQRCNNGWCAYLYDYYFEKDVAVRYVAGAGGGATATDWEHIAVFHGKYETRAAGKVRWDGTHPKAVYHKDGGTRHNFRFANEDDDNIENDKGAYWCHNGFPSDAVRDAMMNNDRGRTSVAIEDASFPGNLDRARGDYVPEFNSSIDDGSPGTPAWRSLGC